MSLVIFPIFFIYFAGKLFLDAAFYSYFRNWLPIDVARGIGFFLGGLGFIFLRHAIHEVPKGFAANLYHNADSRVADNSQSLGMTQIMLLFFIPSMSLFLGIHAIRDSLVIGKNHVSYFGADARGMGLLMVMVGLYAIYALRKEFVTVGSALFRGLGLIKPDSVGPMQEEISANKKKGPEGTKSLKKSVSPKLRRRKK